MKKISKFDLGFIIAAAVVGLLGGGAWYYFSSQLSAAQDAVTAAKSDFDKYSTKANITVSKNNGLILQDNTDLIARQLNPLIEEKFLSKENKVSTIDKEDPVAWKHDLDDEVHRLTSSAKLHGVALPPGFYFGFTRYLNTSPLDDQTAVLSKQRLGVEQISTIMINAQVRSIAAIRRTYEEDPREDKPEAIGSGKSPEADRLSGQSLIAPANAYISYPFEIEFDATTESLRPIVDGLMQSPYVFVIRSLNVRDSSPNSPQIKDLDAMAAPPASVVDSAPGEVGSSTTGAPPTRGPQYLFGSSVLHIKMRVDLIEWTAGLIQVAPPK